MADRLRVAAIQTTCRLGDAPYNLQGIEALLSEVAGRVELTCLPELCDVGYDLKTQPQAALLGLAEIVPAGDGEPAGPTTRRLCELAAGFGLGLVAGVLERDPEERETLYDTTLIIDRAGRVAGRYRKSHLYPAEEGVFRPGGELPVFELEGVRVGIAMCFEAAFAPIYSTLAVKGAQIVFNPSATPAGYEHVLDLRTRARAQDNQVFVVAANHVGAEGAVVYSGRSQIADPRGDLLAVALGDRPRAVCAELDLSSIDENRRREPVLRGYRPELYGFTGSPTEGKRRS